MVKTPSGWLSSSALAQARARARLSSSRRSLFLRGREGVSVPIASQTDRGQVLTSSSKQQFHPCPPS